MDRTVIMTVTIQGEDVAVSDCSSSLETAIWSSDHLGTNVTVGWSLPEMPQTDETL